MVSGNTLGSTLSMAGTGAAVGTVLAPGIGTAIGAGAGALVGFFGGMAADAAAKGDLEREKKIREEVARMYDGVIPPQFEMAYEQKLKSNLEGNQDEQYSSDKIGKLLAQIEKQASGAEDPLLNAQLDRSQQLASTIGQRASMDALAQARSRGVRGPLEFMALMQGQQQGAAQGADAAMQSGMEKYRRQLAAMEQSLTGNERNRGYQMDRSRYLDSVNQFNEQQRLNALGMRNASRQGAYGNKMDLLRAQGAAKLGEADFAADQAARKNADVQAALRGLQSGVAGFGQAYAAGGFGGASPAPQVSPRPQASSQPLVANGQYVNLPQSDWYKKNVGY